METENNENLDSENEETADELDGLDADALKEKYTQLRTKHNEIEGKNRQLFERLKKEQGFERDPDDSTNWIKVSKPVKTETKPSSKPAKSGDDYGEMFLKSELAFHNSKTDSTKIEHDEDIEFLKDTLGSTGKSFTELIQNKYFMAELQERQETRSVKEATPPSTGRGGVTKKDISYWLAQPYDKVPEDMKYKVLDAMKEQGISGRP